MKNKYHFFGIFFFALCISTIPATAQEKLVAQVKQWVNDNNKKLHLQESDLKEMQVTSASTVNQLTFSYVQQYYAGLKVHNAILSLCFDSKGTMVSNSSRFVPKIATKATTANPSVAASDAIKKAAAYLKLPAPVALHTVPDELNSENIFYLPLQELPNKILLQN